MKNKILTKVNQEIIEKGVAKTFKNILEKTKTRVVIKGYDQKLKKIFKKERIIIISNHPAEIDVLLILSTWQKRKDKYLVANHGFLGLLPAIDKHIIPVFITHRIYEAKRDKWKLDLLRKLHFSEVFSKEESHQKNIESINLAAEKVNQGGLVTIFPMAGEENNKFLPGIGHIIKNLKYKNTKIVMAYIRGTSTWDYLRIIPLFNRLMPKISINFSRTMEIKSLKASEPKEIAKELETIYKNWLLSLE